jgi:23S rRNA (guanosine2251-2'-O)-methyltransferase
MATHSLRNPHSILAALQRRPADVLELRINLKGASDAWLAVAALAREHQKPVHLPLGDPDRHARSSPDGGRATGNEATVREISTVSAKSLFNRIETPGLWLALDHIQDPHNVGAILRTAAFFGVRGVVMTRDQSAPLTSIVYDIASGGIEVLPIAIVPNLVQVFEIAKEAGLWILGTSEHEARSVAEVDLHRDWLLVLGNEEKGLRRLVSERCDELCRVPSLGAVTSLNVSVASGVLMAALTSR